VQATRFTGGLGWLIGYKNPLSSVYFPAGSAQQGWKEVEFDNSKALNYKMLPFLRVNWYNENSDVVYCGLETLKCLVQIRKVVLTRDRS